MAGQSLLLPFCWAGTPAFEKGSRCKSETISSRDRSNGYVHPRKKSDARHTAIASKLGSYRASVALSMKQPSLRQFRHAQDRATK